MNEVKEKKKIGLTTRIFIALIAGAIVGIALNMFAADVDFVQNVLVNGIFCCRSGLYPPDADAGRTAGILLADLRRHRHRRQ